MLWGMRLALVAAACAVSARLAAAVDHSKFRTCDQGSFCRRFKKWVDRPSREVPLWTVQPETRSQTSDGGLSFSVKHKEEVKAHLQLTIRPMESGMLRVKLNEIEPLYPRYEPPPGDVLVEPPPKAADLSLEEHPGELKIAFATNKAAKVDVTLKYAPFALEVAVGGRVLQRVNARNLLNFERYRQPLQVRPPDEAATGAGAHTVVIDAASHPHDLDTQGLWDEDFGGHTDRKPRGPAAVGLDVTFEGEVPGVFGLPQHATSLNLPLYEEPYRFWALDVFEYELTSPMALYGGVPLLWGLQRGASGTFASGLLWLNTAETFVKLNRPSGETGPMESWWISESGVLDFVILVGPSPAEVSAQFHALTGPAPLPPLWALGKHQCRWNYKDEKDVALVDANYEMHDLPYDVIWLDIEHTDGKKYFTWSPTYFPTPKRMIDEIAAKKRKVVTIVDPHIKKEDGYRVYQEIKDLGLYVKKKDWQNVADPTDVKPADWDAPAKILDPEATQPEVWSTEEDGEWKAPEIDNPAYKGEWTARQLPDPNSPQSDFEGWCWPGTSMYPDFSHPDMRKHWASQFALDKYEGSTLDLFTWNDMNEPSVFNGPEVSLPRDSIHPFGNVEHRDVHNLYGMYHNRATFEGLSQRNPKERAFVLTRSFWTGSHKYGAIWTGDNMAKWDHLEVSAPMVLSIALGGCSFIGADVGGFFYNPEEELMVRWYQFGALAYPFLRNHAHLETPRREPYLLQPDNLARVKTALQTRYRMLPIWYTAFREFHTTGKPVVRPLWYDFASDPNTHQDNEILDHHVMLSDVMLVRSVVQTLEKSKEVAVYLPVGEGGGWYDVTSGSFLKPGHYTVPLTMEQVPAYYRAASIVPIKTRVRRSSSCMHQDPLTLVVYLDPETGKARGKVYVDDYTSMEYQDGRSFLEVDLEFADGALRATAAEGELAASISSEVERVRIQGLRKAPEKATFHRGGESTVLDRPRSTAMGELFSAEVKRPGIDLRQGTAWSLSIA